MLQDDHPLVEGKRAFLQSRDGYVLDLIEGKVGLLQLFLVLLKFFLLVRLKQAFKSLGKGLKRIFLFFLFLFTHSLLEDARV